MTPRQRIEVRQTEVRAELSEIIGLETRSDENRARLAELTAEAQSLDLELRAAILVEPEPVTVVTTATPEGREQLELRGRFRVARVIQAALGGQRVQGVEAEYADAVGAAAGQIPTDIYETRSGVPELETREITPGVAGGAQQRPIVPAIFDRTIAPFLGVSMPSAGVGDAAFPVLGTSVTAATKAKDAAAPETAGAFTVASIQPRRIAGAFLFRFEDQARLMGMEEALRRNLQMVLSDKVDEQLLNGSASADNTDGEIRGLLAKLTDPDAPAAGAETFERYVASFAENVDGLYAVDQSGVKGLVGQATYQHMAQKFRTGNSANESFASYASRNFGGVRATRRIAAAASNVQQGVIVRANPMGDSCAVMPHWSAFDLTVRDVYTKAAEGQVKVTATTLVGDIVLLRSGCYVQDSWRLT